MSRFGLRTRSGQVNDIFEPQKVIATGGTVTDIIQDGIPYRVHTFTGSGNFVVIRGGLVEMLLVGGGGGARESLSFEGGGGAGSGGVSVNLLINNNYIGVEEGTYPIVIGAGGAAGGSPTNGDDSEAFGQVAFGGGFGTRGGSNPGRSAATSGGRGTATSTATAFPIITTFEGYQGYNGGARTVGDVALGGAGGGGATSAGTDITNTGGGVGFAGGLGYTTTIRGTSETFATGGQGSTVGQAGVNGGANTGDGARSAGINATLLAGGTGGSGICIIRYKL